MPNKQPEYLGGGKKIGQSEGEGQRPRDSYNRANFYIASMSGKGDYEKVRVPHNEKDNVSIRVPPYLWAEAFKWVDDVRTPYRNINDYWRDSGFHRAVDLNELDKSNGQGQWLAFQIQSEIERRAQEAERHKQSIRRIKTIIGEASENGDKSLYDDTINQAHQLADVIPEPYASQLHEFLNGQKNLRHLRADES